MTLRQGCARITINSGAYNPLNIGECARMRQDRQGLPTYCAHERKTQRIKHYPLYSNKCKNPGDPGANSIYAGFLRFNPGATLAQPWRRQA
jgi:hypothetical protein